MNDYFFLDKDNKQQGPVSVSRFPENGVTRNTLVWCSGLSGWTRAESVPELKDWFEQHPDPAPQSATPPPSGGQGAATGGQGYTPGSGGAAGGYGPSPYGPALPCPDSHLAGAILVTIFCCLPFGIVAIVKANEVGTFYAAGRYDQALLASADAKKWVMLSLLFGLITCCVCGGFSLIPRFF